MDCPKLSGSLDYNYKGFFSLVLLAMCDAKYVFTMIDVGQYGSSGVLLNSEMGLRFDEGSMKIPKPEVVEGYPLGKLPYYKCCSLYYGCYLFT